MKTAISVPDHTFRRVESRAAELKMNRSEFFSRAAERFLNELDEESLTVEINAAIKRGDEMVHKETAALAETGVALLDALTADDEW
jgi:predicted DNA-binding protein